MKNSLVSILYEHYRIGCNLFEILFDLSYRRKGALLIYDPEHNVLPHITNQGSICNQQRSGSDPARAMLAPSIAPISMGNSLYSARKKRLFLEIACMDGAVVFDSDNVLAFGAMIETHPHSNSHAGARTTAFESSFLWGSRPMKISSDGDISIMFGSENEPSIIRFM